MEFLIASLEASKYLKRFLGTGRLDGNRLEASFQRRVLFHVASVFVPCGGADAVEFAPAERGLKHIGHVVGGILDGSGAQHGVHLVDEEDRLAVLFKGAEELDDFFLELAAVGRSGHQARKIQSEDFLAKQRFGYFAFHDSLGQAFHDGGLADAGFAQKHGIVLLPAAQNDGETVYLFFTSDQRIELVFLGKFRKVDAESRKDLIGIGLFLHLLVGGKIFPGARRRKAAAPQFPQVTQIAGIDLLHVQRDEFHPDPGGILLVVLFVP